MYLASHLSFYVIFLVESLLHLFLTKMARKVTNISNIDLVIVVIVVLFAQATVDLHWIIFFKVYLCFTFPLHPRGPMEVLQLRYID
jgi:hypothetical protein